MLSIPRISLGLYIKLSLVVVLVIVAKFTLVQSKTPGKSDKCDLELVVSDFNHKAINNAKVFIYESLHSYEEDSPININNWEQRGNHYKFTGLMPGQYYFRVVSSSLDNSSDVYSTSKKLSQGDQFGCEVTLK